MKSFPQLRIVLRAVGLAPLVSWRLKRNGIPAVRPLFEGRRIHSSPLTTEMIVTLVDRTIDNPFSRRIFRIRCLERCVVQSLVLRRYGRESDVGVGIKKTSTDLMGHAWLWADGVCYSGESSPEHYTEMIRLSEWIARAEDAASRDVTPAGSESEQSSR